MALAVTKSTSAVVPHWIRKISSDKKIDAKLSTFAVCSYWIKKISSGKKIDVRLVLPDAQGRTRMSNY